MKMNNNESWERGRNPLKTRKSFRLTTFEIKSIEFKSRNPLKTRKSFRLFFTVVVIGIVETVVIL